MHFNWYLFGICLVGSFAYGFVSGENAALTTRNRPSRRMSVENRWIVRFLGLG